MITTKSISQSKPQTELDWTGNPMRTGDNYYGEKPPETPPEKPHKRYSAEGLANLRASMARCRARQAEKRARAKANN